MRDQRELTSTAVESIESLFEPLSEGVLFCEANRIRFGNAAAVRLLGGDRPSQLGGEPIERFLDAPTLECLTAGAGSRSWILGWPRRLDGTRIQVALRASLAGSGCETAGPPLVVYLSGRARPDESALGPGVERMPEPPIEDDAAPVSEVDQLRHRLEGTFHDLVEAAPYGLLIADPEGRVVLANRRLCQLFGYEPREILGGPIERLLPERHRVEHRALVERYRETPSLRPMGPGRDLTALHRDGREFPVEIGIGPIDWGGQRMTLAAVVDISARKKMELELRQANVHLEEFTFVASHDLKSPLRGIADLTEWIREDLGERGGAEVARNLERVKIRVARLEGMIDDLLRYARAGRASAELVPVDPRELIDVILELQPRPSGFEVRVNVQAEPFPAARTPLETVLRNLISNAIKHHDRERGTIQIEVHAAGAYTVFSVADDGPGIPSAAQERVFRLFQTVSAARRQSSGIGLALASRLAQSHGGRIELESHDRQRGSTFRVFWPRFPRRDLDG